MESPAFKSFLDEIASAPQEGTLDQTHPEEEASSKNNSVGPVAKVAGGQASVDGDTTDTGPHVTKSSSASTEYRRNKKKKMDFSSISIDHQTGINEYDPEYKKVRVEVLRTVSSAFASYVPPKQAQLMA